MTPKKKTATSTKKKSVSTKKAAVKKTAVKPEAAKATKKKIIRSPKTPQIEGVAGTNASAAKAGQSVGESTSGTDSRTQYEKLVNPQNYNEYMRASRFRGNR